ncbi:hypothetical protein EMA8858_00783 [Emticicia aquatica]|uniref:Flavinylation-associated cytochrome domain-containing protein n=1 Tax=Emticicia aquatica TaxID=1681835 RepID=A0ABN8ERY2_9BACT|nr:DUF4405 domain-containing protein [Emticicia aquatica]CAH0994671.1 hypothetical protein EMA8858_00783 [Emticicia aquatica]
MKKKNIISLSVAFAFLALSITGVLLYIKQKAHAVEMTHTIFGLIFVGFAIFHIVNNWSSITGYSKERKSGKFQKEFIIAGIAFLVILAGAITELLEPVAEAGRIFAGKRPPRPEQLTFSEVKTNNDVKGTALTILLEKTKETELPVTAIWVEDSAHNFVENLFVPAKIAAIPADEEEAREGHFDISDFKAETLTVWSGKAKVKTANFEQETPHDNFVLKTNTTSIGQFFILLEVKSGNKTEVYEASVDKAKGDVFKLKSKENGLIARGLVEL